MPMTYSLEERNLIAEGRAERLAGGRLLIYAGATLLVDVPLPDPAVTGPVDGVLTLLPAEATITASGTAMRFEALTADDALIGEGDVGLTGSGAALAIPKIEFELGQIFLLSGTLTVPETA